MLLLAVVRMHKIQPTKSLRGAGLGARIFVKSIADVIPGTISLSAENDIGSGSHNSVEFLIFSRQFTVKLLQSCGPSFQFLGSLRNALPPVPGSELPTVSLCDAVRQIC